MDGPIGPRRLSLLQGGSTIVLMNGHEQRALQAARMASVRTAAEIKRQMKRRLNSLATIASTASWIGLFGTVFGIPTSFIGCGGNAATCMAAMVERLSGAIWTTALGLGVALIALWFYRYLSSEVERFDSEMEDASLSLVNHLSRSMSSTNF